MLVFSVFLLKIQWVRQNKIMLLLKIIFTEYFTDIFQLLLQTGHYRLVDLFESRSSQVLLAL